MVNLDPTEPTVAYFLGLLHTDGTHDGDVAHKGRVTIELAERDVDILHALADALPLKTTIRTRTRVTNFTGGEPYTCFSLSVFDQEFRRWLATMRMPPGRKATSIGPPLVDFSHRDYLRGIIDGDGSVGYTKTNAPFISFVTASSELAGFVGDAIYATSRKSRTLHRNARDGVFNVMVTNLAAALLADYIWSGTDVLGIARKKQSGLSVAKWRPPVEKAGRYGVVRQPWTAEEDAIVLANSDTAAALALGRTAKSVTVRRWRLKKALVEPERAVSPSDPRSPA
ncbi:LAGLIDADG family homing endonuclease [Tsukamurella paurometabola]|uniref:LAGLIDADG family homing endonuclease n=1 Tax=Tsukamurella paurometabola TaxID=2061 RepID=A0ABS5NDZ2_TSUPA|nr:LAGLIDADG family homing endonuclease [Tsukamurella paurometabola]MBS4102486.1 LAGLIDADG family homing endonuclease [Tsukamurella paurometabola]